MANCQWGECILIWVGIQVGGAGVQVTGGQVAGGRRKNFSIRAVVSDFYELSAFIRVHPRPICGAGVQAIERGRRP